MTLRTPRRRISPRTRLRYRAIREFFRRALGSNSQQHIKIHSSIAVNVTDLKRKIVGLEQQLGEVTKHCRDIESLDQSRRESETCHFELKQDIDDIRHQDETTINQKSNGSETQLIYESSGCQDKVIKDSHAILRSSNVNDEKQNITVMKRSDGHAFKVTDKKNKPYKISNTSNKLHKHKARSFYDSTAMLYSTSSFHSLANTRVLHPNNIYARYSNESRKPYKEENREDIIPHHHKSNKHHKNMKMYVSDYVKGHHEDKPRERIRKTKRNMRDVDQEFIADIVRRQYKPDKLCNRKHSDLSQFSAPICRDQEPVQVNSKPEYELCSCFYGGVASHRRLKSRRYDLNTMQSVCDARLYSSKKHSQQKHRKMYVDAHSNSDVYDLVPVKERSSPKSRKKFVEDSGGAYEYYKEVPPSPRTLRPRLNLKAQYYTELDDYMVHTKHPLRKLSPKPQKHYQDCSEEFESDITSGLVSEKCTSLTHQPQKNLKVPVDKEQFQNQSHQDTTTTIPYQYPQYVNEQTCITNDSSLNKTQATEATIDKTDKALTEIKDILQSFLHEIKKETVTSQCDKSDTTSKIPDDSNVLQDANPNVPPNLLPNAASFSNYNVGQCGIAPLMAPFTNPCCYQVMPMCSLNCPMSVPNGYVVPSQSFTCTNCVKTPKENSSIHCCNKTTDLPCHTDTEELIKEIYKFVAQGPPRNNENNTNELKKEESKILTSRSADDKKFYKQDANVGTQPLRSYSKSCEAIGSGMTSESYNIEGNESYSDSLLEKLSGVEVTPQTYSITEMDSTVTDTDKVLYNNYHIPQTDKRAPIFFRQLFQSKGNRLSKVLRSFGLFKMFKKDVIEEASENESVIREQIENQPPFRQNIPNYMMYAQEYFQPPPVKPVYTGPREYPSRWHEYQRGPHEYQPDYQPPYNPGVRGDSPILLQDPYSHRYIPQMNEHHSEYMHGSKQRPSAPPFSSSYDSSYGAMQPGLCLKEIEVKSTGTQSERRISIFKKLTKKPKQTVKCQISPRVTFCPYVNQGAWPHGSPGGCPHGSPGSCPRESHGNCPRGSHDSCPHGDQCCSQQKRSKLFSWKTLQSKALQGLNTDMNYDVKDHQKFAAGDQKIRNALLNRLLNSKNPLNPRNKIIKSLLKKDKTLADIL